MRVVRQPGWPEGVTHSRSVGCATWFCSEWRSSGARRGDEQVVIPHLDELMRVLAFAVISQPYRLQGEDVRFLRKYLKMTQTELAELMDVDKTTLSKWENNDDRIGDQSDRLVRAVALALGDGLKERMEAIIRSSFPRIHNTKRRPRLECDAEKLSYSYA